MVADEAGLGVDVMVGRGEGGTVGSIVGSTVGGGIVAVRVGVTVRVGVGEGVSAGVWVALVRGQDIVNEKQIVMARARQRGQDTSDFPKTMRRMTVFCAW